MPTIKLFDKYRLISAHRTWELQQRSTRKHRRTGEIQENWESFRWYTSLENALRDAIEFGVRNSQTEDIHEAMQEAKNLLAALIQGWATHRQPEIEQISAFIAREQQHDN